LIFLGPIVVNQVNDGVERLKVGEAIWLPQVKVTKRESLNVSRIDFAPGGSVNLVPALS